MDRGANLDLNKHVSASGNRKVQSKQVIWGLQPSPSAQNMTESVKWDNSPPNQNCSFPLAWGAIYLNCFTVSWHILEISAEGMSDCFKKKKKRTFEKLNCSVSFEISWPGYSRQSTDLVVSCFTSELFSFCITEQRKASHLLRLSPQGDSIELFWVLPWPQ